MLADGSASGNFTLTIHFKINGFAKGILQVLSFGLSWSLAILDWFAGKFLVFIRTSFNFGRAMRSESLLLNVISRPVGIRNNVFAKDILKVSKSLLNQKGFQVIFKGLRQCADSNHWKQSVDCFDNCRPCMGRRSWSFEGFNAVGNNVKIVV